MITIPDCIPSGGEAILVTHLTLPRVTVSHREKARLSLEAHQCVVPISHYLPWPL